MKYITLMNGDLSFELDTEDIRAAIKDFVRNSDPQMGIELDGEKVLMVGDVCFGPEECPTAIVTAHFKLDRVAAFQSTRQQKGEPK